MILCDTNILIEYLKKNQKVQQTLRNKPILISAVSYMEMAYGARDKQDLKVILTWISKIKIKEIDTTISSRARYLTAQYTLSHNLDMPDALIAATAIELKLPLYTLNTKHFQYIPEIILYAT